MDMLSFPAYLMVYYTGIMDMLSFPAYLMVYYTGVMDMLSFPAYLMVYCGNHLLMCRAGQITGSHVI